MNGEKSINYHQLQSVKEVERLHRQGITISNVDDATIELRQEWNGFRRIKTLHEPDIAMIQAWIEQDSIYVLEIDPTLVDTSLYAGWYTYWATVPVFNGFGLPTLAGDINNNGKIEIYGGYRDTTMHDDYETHLYEVDNNGIVDFIYKYVPRRGGAIQFSDANQNGLKEVVFILGDTSYFYEQRHGNGYPIYWKFSFNKFESSGAYFSRENITNLDNDSSIDYVFLGSPPDSILHGYQTTIAEYDNSLNNFKKIWSTNLWPPNDAGVGGYDVGDYDNDNKMNILASGMNGQVWVIENTGDDSYELSWKDSIPLINLFYQTSGDVDDDGKREFFVCATMSSGNWVVVYEADSNDAYAYKFLFHLLAGGLLDEPILLTEDVDSDNKVEFIILSGGQLHIFKSNGDNLYYLWYFQWNDDASGVNVYDFNSDWKKDIIVSKFSVNDRGMGYAHSDIYRATGMNDVAEDKDLKIPQNITLYQNYPNPFNPSTQIIYSLPKATNVTLKVYDILGREIALLVNERKQPGEYKVTWNAKGLPSGVYFSRIVAGDFIETKKMAVVK